MIGYHKNKWFLYENDDRFRSLPHRKFHRFARTKIECTDVGETSPITVKNVKSKYITIDGAIVSIRRDDVEIDDEEGLVDGIWWEQIFHRLDERNKNMLINAKVLCDGQQLANLISDRRLILVSDGSYDQL